jgi:hypothetical protein
MFCDMGFRADGLILLQNASIRDDLSFKAAQLSAPDGPVLNADGLTVGGTMYCDEEFRADGEIILRSARIGVLADDKGSWPPLQDLGGLTYGDLRPYLPARERLDWLGRSAEYQGQPFEELVAYYRRLGHDGRHGGCSSPGSGPATACTPASAAGGDGFRMHSSGMGTPRGALWPSWAQHSLSAGRISVRTIRRPSIRPHIHPSTPLSTP